MDITCAESGATYEQIKNYVLDKYGFKVSTVYIVQVKRKHSLDVRKNYSVSKDGNQKVSQCLAEKERVILDALRHCKEL